MTPSPPREAAALSPKLSRRISISPTGCWTWTAWINRHGYGQTGGKLAHRLVYEDMVGPIPEGLTIDHLCRNRACVNPAHLEPVSNLENQRRGFWATKTHCKHGHPLDEDNVYRRPGTRQRGCRTCNGAAVRARERKRAAA